MDVPGSGPNTRRRCGRPCRREEALWKAMQEGLEEVLSLA
jgi:hypothetical protein